jgi:hypothetical protein
MVTTLLVTDTAEAGPVSKKLIAVAMTAAPLLINDLSIPTSCV